MRRVIDELERSGRLKTLTIEIDGAKQAVSLSLLHGNKMIALYASSNNDYNNLGKLLNVETIQEACRLRVDEISFMTGMQWKADWKMKGEPCLTMRKPPAPWPESEASPDLALPQVAPGMQLVVILEPAIADVGAVVHVGNQDVLHPLVRLRLRLLHGDSEAGNNEDDA